MRIESKARRGCSSFELSAQSGAGATSAALLVRLLGDRRPQDVFLDRICLPISLLNFEPFCSTVRPNGLKHTKQQKLQSRCQTKRSQKALNSGAFDELFIGFKCSGSETLTAF